MWDIGDEVFHHDPQKKLAQTNGFDRDDDIITAEGQGPFARRHLGDQIRGDIVETVRLEKLSR